MWGHYQPRDWKIVYDAGGEDSLDSLDFCGFVFKLTYDSSINDLRNIGKSEVEEIAKKRGADIVARSSSKGYQRVSVRGRYFFMKHK